MFFTGKLEKIGKSSILFTLSHIYGCLRLEMSLLSYNAFLTCSNQIFFMQHNLEFYTTIAGLSPNDVHHIGLSELEDLKKKMLELAAKFGYKNTTFKEFTTAMKNNQSQFFSRSQIFIIKSRPCQGLVSVFGLVYFFSLLGAQHLAVTSTIVQNYNLNSFVELYCKLVRGLDACLCL